MATKTNEDLRLQERWTKKAKHILEGRTIVIVRYLDDEEMEAMGWHKRPIAFQLDNGTLVIAQMDDEGNDGGVLFYQTKTHSDILPVL